MLHSLTSKDILTILLVKVVNLRSLGELCEIQIAKYSAISSISENSGDFVNVITFRPGSTNDNSDGSDEEKVKH